MNAPLNISPIPSYKPESSPKFLFRSLPHFINSKEIDLDRKPKALKFEIKR